MNYERCRMPSPVTKKLYIGNLPYHMTESQLRQLFRRYEPIHSVVMISDRDTMRSKGYCFVELEERKANVAVGELDQKTYLGRQLRVSDAIGGNSKKDGDENLGKDGCLNCPLVRAISARMVIPRAMSA